MIRFPPPLFMIIPSYINDPAPSPSPLLRSSFSDIPDEVIMLIINTFITENGMKFFGWRCINNLSNGGENSSSPIVEADRDTTMRSVGRHLSSHLRMSSISFPCPLQQQQHHPLFTHSHTYTHPLCTIPGIRITSAGKPFSKWHKKR